MYSDTDVIKVSTTDNSLNTGIVCKTIISLFDCEEGDLIILSSTDFGIIENGLLSLPTPSSGKITQRHKDLLEIVGHFSPKVKYPYVVREHTTNS